MTTIHREAERILRPPSRVAMLQRVPQGGVAVEIGVFRGAFAEHIRTILHPSRLLLIDGWRAPYPHPLHHDPEESYRIVERKFGDDPCVDILRGESVETIAGLRDESIDFAYVDADHRYGSCLADMEALWPKMRPGGWLCGHDFCELRWFGVVRAVAVFCDRHDLTLDLLTDEPPIEVPSAVTSPPWFSRHSPKHVAFNSFGLRIPLAKAP